MFPLADNLSLQKRRKTAHCLSATHAFHALRGNTVTGTADPCERLHDLLMFDPWEKKKKKKKSERKNLITPLDFLTRF